MNAAKSLPQMPDILKPEDLFDFDAYGRRINDMIKLNGQFEKSAAAMATHITNAQKPLLKHLESIVDKIEKVNVSQNKNIEMLITLEKESQAYTTTLDKQRKLLGLLDDSYRGSVKSVSALEESLAKLKSEYGKLDSKQENFNKKHEAAKDEFSELKASIDAQSLSLKAASAAVGNAEGSYTRLSRETEELRKKLNGIPDALKNIEGASKIANSGFEALHKIILENDSALQDFNISLEETQESIEDSSDAIMSSIDGGFWDALGGKGLDVLIWGLQKLGEAIVEFEKLDNTFRRITKSNDEFNTAQKAIGDTALQNGQNIESLSESYMDLISATRDTHLEGLATEQIFKAIAKAGASVKMSTEELNGAFGMIVSMMDGTSVKLEDFRKQWGEELYEALLRSAKGLGINETQLAKIFEKGEVMQTKLLPRLAQEFNKVSDEKAQKNLETISGSWEYLKTNVSLLIKAFNDDGTISKFFSTIINGVGSILGEIRKALNDKDWVSFFTNIGALLTPGGIVGKLLESKVAPKRKEPPTFEQNLHTFEGKPKKEREEEIKQYQEKIKKADAAIVQSHIDMVGKNTKQLLEINKTIDKQTKIRDEFENELKQLQKSHDELLKAETTVKKPSGNKGDTKEKLTELERLEAINTRLTKSYADQIALKEQGKNYDKAKLESTEKDLLANENLIKKIKEKTDLSPKSEYEKIKDAVKHYTDILREQLVLKETQCGVYDEQIIKNAKAQIECYTQMLDKIEKELAQLERKSELLEQQKQLTADVNELSSKKEKPSEIKKPFKELSSNEMAFDLSVSRVAQQGISKMDDAGNIWKLMKVEKEMIQEIEALKLKFATKGYQDRLALLQKEFKKKAELREKELKEEDDKEKRKRKLIEQYIDAGKQIATASFEFLSMQNKAEMEDLEAKKKHELELAGNNADAKAAIEKKYNADILEIKRKQAKVEKAQAIFNIGINTAQAIMKFLNDPGGVPGVILSAAAAITGGIQLATALNKPLPQYFKGTDNAPEGLALVAERGPELRETKGRMVYYDKPQVAWLHQGDKIHTAEQTSRILAQNQVNQELANHASQTRLMELRYINQFGPSPIDTRPIEKAIETSFGRMPIHVTQIDQNGFSEYTKSQNAKTDYNRKRFSLPG